MDLSVEDLEYFLENPFLKYNLLEEEGRCVWVNEYNNSKNRKELGEYNCVVVKLRKKPKRFFKYFKIKIATFDYILENIESTITKYSLFRECIGPAEKLAVTIRYLTRGLSIRSLALGFRMGHCSVTCIIKEVTTAIWNKLVHKHMPLPTSEMLNEIKSDFFDRYSFPNCIGCIETLEFSPLFLHMLIDSNAKFSAVTVDDFENEDPNATLFGGSVFTNFLQTYKQNIPEHKNYTCEEDKIPHVIIASNAYPMKNDMLRAYSKKKLQSNELLFNNRLFELRQCVDEALKIFATKWECLLKISDLRSTQRSISIIKCCCLLHNLIIEREKVNVNKINVDTQAFNSISVLRAQRSRFYSNYTNLAQSVRKAFQEYLVKLEEGKSQENQTNST